ncbi:MAG: alkaline phosphatase [Gammaproteobacteria bacterium]|nr:alkaline phosphatase [Gammaproteobacteria bacterium]
MKKLVVLILLLIGQQVVASEVSEHEQKPKNVILMIGDGMGPSVMKAYRMYKDNGESNVENKTEFDHYLIGSVNTNPNDRDGNITDSAASATAYATGIKTYNGAISVDINQKRLETVLEIAKKHGKSTGLVATSEINHATPAAFATHTDSRRNKLEIANQFYDNQINNQPVTDVILGGGLDFFARQDRNLVSAFQSKGYQFVSNKTQLEKVKSDSKKLLGLFAPVAMAKKWDRDENTPSLSLMTDKAIDVLSRNPKGFFLMVEGSQIDWAGHGNDIVSVLSEMEDFEAAVKTAMDFARKDKNTLVIVTADHATGGLSLGLKADGKAYYQWGVELLKTFKYTPFKIIELAKHSGNLAEELKKASQIKLTADEITSLNKVDLTDDRTVYYVLNQLISNKTYTGWTTSGHTAVDVNLYAFGPGSNQLAGHRDNTEIGQLIMSLISTKGE